MKVLLRGLIAELVLANFVDVKCSFFFFSFFDVYRPPKTTIFYNVVGRNLNEEEIAYLLPNLNNGVQRYNKYLPVVTLLAIYILSMCYIAIGQIS